MRIDFRLHRQLKPFTGYDQSRVAKSQFAGVDPTSIGSALYSIERLGKLLLEPFFHLIH